MALQIQTFKTRAFTAIAFIIIMFAGLFINAWSFLLLFSVIHFGCWFEYQKIISLIFPSGYVPVFFKYAVMPAGFGLMFWLTNDAFIIGTINLNNIGKYIFFAGLIVCLINIISAYRRFSLKIILAVLTGLLYISLSCGLMLNLRTQNIIFSDAFSLDFGLVLPLVIIATLWINDTMAYIVGSLIGKTQLSSVSPKKTWEGTIGGVVIAVAAITSCSAVFFKADIMQLVLITVITCLSGIAGDLFESKLKRMANIKDSGNIMPGHGGFLDRFDSLLMATIFVWVYVKLFL